MAIKGLNRLKQQVRGIANGSYLTETALAKAAVLVQKEARKNVPKGDTRTLAQSIQINVEAEEQRATVGSNLSYAPYVEFGTGIFAAKGNGRQTPWSYQNAKGEWFTTIGQHPQPFLHPAFNSSREGIQRIFQREVQKKIKEKVR